MAHGITKTDNLMVVGEKAWHGLGMVLPRLATAQEAIEAAQLGWTVEREPIMRNGRHADGKWFNIRSDTQEVLSITGGDYQPLQNEEAFRFFDAVTQDPNGAKYVSAGSLFGGRKVWLLAKLPEFIQVEDDIIEEYLLLVNPHTGIERLHFLWTSVRVVCNNTLTLAQKKERRGYRFKHVGNIQGRISDIQNIMGIVRQNHQEFQEISLEMARYEPSEEEIDDVLRDLFASSDSEEELGTQTKNRIESVKSLVFAGRGQGLSEMGTKDTAWSLFNGITEYLDHYSHRESTTQEKKFDSVIWGRAAQLKERAFHKVQDLVLSNR